jgi:hypothetical protein
MIHNHQTRSYPAGKLFPKAHRERYRGHWFLSEGDRRVHHKEVNSFVKRQHHKRSRRYFKREAQKEMYPMVEEKLPDPTIYDLREFLEDLAEHGWNYWKTSEETAWRNHCARVLAERFPKMCAKLDSMSDGWEGT